MRRRCRDERGQVTTALVIVMVTSLVAISLFGILALSRGVDERSQAQSAADAAALAGAGALEAALPGLLGQLASPGSGLGGVAGCDVGRTEAEQYASENEASLTAYCFDLSTGRVTASVQMNEAVTDEVDAAQASAEASTGLDLGSCTWDEEEPPQPEDDDGDDDDGGDGDSGDDGGGDPPPPLPDIPTALECDGLVGSFSIDGETGELSLVDLEIPALEPSLEQ